MFFFVGGREDISQLKVLWWTIVNRAIRFSVCLVFEISPLLLDLMSLIYPFQSLMSILRFYSSDTSLMTS